MSAKQGKVLNDAVALKVNTSDIDNLTSTDTNKPLRVLNQGKALQDTKEALENKAKTLAL